MRSPRSPSALAGALLTAAPHWLAATAREVGFGKPNPGRPRTLAAEMRKRMSPAAKRELAAAVDRAKLPPSRTREAEAGRWPGPVRLTPGEVTHGHAEVLPVEPPPKRILARCRCRFVHLTAPADGETASVRCGRCKTRITIECL